MKDMSLAPLDQQAKQEMEGSIRFVEGGKKKILLSIIRVPQVERQK